MSSPTPHDPLARAAHGMTQLHDTSPARVHSSCRARAELLEGRSEKPTWLFEDDPERRGIAVGSGLNCAWRIVAAGVAPLHLLLLWDGSRLWVSNVGGSRVSVDGELLEGWRELPGNARIQLGRATLRIDCKSDLVTGTITQLFRPQDLPMPTPAPKIVLKPPTPLPRSELVVRERAAPPSRETARPASPPPPAPALPILPTREAVPPRPAMARPAMASPVMPRPAAPPPPSTASRGPRPSVSERAKAVTRRLGQLRGKQLLTAACVVFCLFAVLRFVRGGARPARPESTGPSASALASARSSRPAPAPRRAEPTPQATAVEEPPPEAREALRAADPPPDAKLTPKSAADLLVAGRLEEAEAQYRALAARHPDDPAFGLFAELTARRLKCPGKRPCAR
jgi:hypothetical protein